MSHERSRSTGESTGSNEPIHGHTIQPICQEAGAKEGLERSWNKPVGTQDGLLVKMRLELSLFVHYLTGHLTEADLLGEGQEGGR